MGKNKSSPAGLGALYERVCGLDVHKKVIVASLRILDPRKGTVHMYAAAVRHDDGGPFGTERVVGGGRR